MPARKLDQEYRQMFPARFFLFVSGFFLSCLVSFFPSFFLVLSRESYRERGKRRTEEEKEGRRDSPCFWIRLSLLMRARLVFFSGQMSSLSAFEDFPSARNEEGRTKAERVW